jgi:hypothetical protein
MKTVKKTRETKTIQGRPMRKSPFEPENLQSMQSFQSFLTLLRIDPPVLHRKNFTELTVLTAIEGLEESAAC